MKTILKIRDICKEHHSCYDNCPFHVDNECVLGIPPANWSDDDLYLISKAVDQEPTTKNDLGVDAVSRQEVLYLIADNDLSMGQVVRGIHALPSVTPQEPRWIPVSERLPEANIYDGHGPVWKHEVLITGYLSFDDKKETFVNMAFAEDVRNKCAPNTNVTAWMPLPEPYKAEFHCGIEESGFHAYNCNDCPNKCKEWYQWEKEIKE